MKPIQQERAYRLSQLQSFDQSLLSSFRSLLSRSQLNPQDVLPVLEYCLNVDYNHVGMSSDAYLNHPLRVSLLAFNETPIPSYELIATSLLHNLKELSVESFNSLSIVPQSVLSSISLLTVDRSQTSVEYRDSYYAALSSQSYVAQVKIFDKLDNLFLLCRNPSSSIREAYLQEIESYVYPLVSRFVPHLSNYFIELVADARATGHIQL